MNEEIKKWLNGSRDYDEGVLLYVKYGKNDNLKRLLPGRKRYADKLAYELSKLSSGVASFAPEPEKKKNRILNKLTSFLKKK